MGYKPPIQNEIVSNHKEEFNKELFIEHVFNNEYVLVIGSEVILNKEIEPTGDVAQYVLHVVNSTLKKNYKDFNELNMLEIDELTGIKKDVIRSLLNSDSFSYDIEDMSVELINFLKTKLFRYVLTTTFDSYLEALMKQIWGKELRIVNINDDRSMNELRNEITKYRDESIYLQPTLFYIFGKAVKDESKKYVQTDDDAIQIIDKWIRLREEDPVMRFLRSKRLLALGCKFDNWYFRFFWYILRRDKGNENGRKILKPGEAAITFLENDRSDEKLKTYLKRSEIKVLDDARIFMKRIAQDLITAEEKGLMEEKIINNRRPGGIFLSYCSKDVVIASRLFFMLLKNQYDVWFDNASLNGGDNYDNKIEEAIASARIFIPILTPHVAKDLTDGKTENYYNQEWRMASQFGDKVIIPLALNGYDLRQPYHTKMFESIIRGSISGINLMNEGFEKLTRSIDEQMKVNSL